MQNKEIRDRKEIDNLFKDPKYCRQAWRSIGNAILQSPVTRMPTDYDKDGNPTLRSSLEDYSYSSLKRDIATLCKQDGITEREPTELEMIMQCQIAKARFDTNAAIFVRDTLGAKPIDESKIDATLSNPYEDLTDEELAILAEHRKQTDQSTLEHSASPQAIEQSPASQHIVNEQAPYNPTRVSERTCDIDETSIYQAKQWIKYREWEEQQDDSSQASSASLDETQHIVKTTQEDD